MSNDLKAIKITYAEAERCDKSKKLLRKIRCRIKGGSVHDELFFSFKALLGGRRSKSNVRAFWRAAVSYFFSSTLANKLLFDEAYEESKFEKPFCPRENSCMYHWTAIENAAGITKHGILPMGNSKYVYITDDPEFIAKSGYLHWKVLAAKKDTIFVPIKIDAHALAAEYEIMKVFSLHEYAVKHIPPEFIINEQAATSKSGT